MRTKLIVGNWKMNKDINESAALIEDLKNRLKDFRGEVEIVICPPFTSLVIASALIKDSPIRLGAQNMSDKDDGALTGEISARMLTAIGCQYVILGHSERRQYFKETNEYINLKVHKALKSNLIPIICVGETLEERESGVTDKVVSTQIKGVLRELTSDDMKKVIIAYEPVWAIGTGKNATQREANEVHKLIRKLVGQMYSWPVAESLTILYGGSVSPTNALELLSEPDIDGALVGGACLKADSFFSIINAGLESMHISSK